MAGGSALLRRRPLVLAGLALVLALVIAITLAVTKPWAGTKTRDDVAAPASGDRVLQSVDVTMQPDGALTRVGDTVVIARGQGGRSDTYTTAYDPAKVVDQLPVRVLTAYRTDQGSGTDLADLKGYSGRVSLDLTVQNLTVTPQQITYDVAGRSQTTTALVGAPLTVVASATLPGVAAASVATAAPDVSAGSSSDTAATNGVLSQAQDGSTQVQWASILAPPQLDSTATFRLVVDAKDFQVPTVDLSVQPGLVTDPSVGALIDAAFNPKNSSELALETRTITLIGDVNQVLGRASDTISGVRRTLDASSKTLGTKTVQSLTADTKTISSSLKSSSTDIDSLGDDLKQALQTNQSSTLKRMSETVSGLEDIIGDTSGTASATGGTCGQEVRASGGGDGVYGNLLRVIAQLDKYAAATADCKQGLKDDIAATIGPSNPDETTCPEDDSPDSVVCSLVNAQRQFDVVTGNITTAQSAAARLDPDPARGTTAASELEDLSASLSTLVDRLLGLEGDQDPAETTSDVASARDDLADAAAPLERLSDQLKTINARAGDNVTAVGRMIDQDNALAARMCDLATSGRLTSSEVEELRSYLVDTPCAGDDSVPGSRTSLLEQLGAQQAAWTRLEAQTGPDSPLADGVQSAQANLEQVRTALDDASTRLTKSAGTEQDVKDVLAEINQARKESDQDAKNLNTFSAYVDNLTDRYDAAQNDLDAALKTAQTSSEAAAGTNVDSAIKQILAQQTKTDEDLETAFDNSSQGLTDAASELSDGALKTLRKQRDDLAAQEKDDEDTLNAQTKSGLSAISGSIGSATRDIDSTRTSLAKDLDNVLLDLGTPNQPGKGLLGTLGKSADAADSADFQLGLASDTVSSYAAVRGQEVGGILLRQAQAEAALQRQADLPAFETDIPATVQHRTIYAFHVGGDR